MRYLLIFVPLLFCACDAMKHQQEIDHELEDIAVEAAKEQVKVGGSSMEEDVAERAAKRLDSEKK